MKTESAIVAADELAWLAATAARSQTICEIGCWQGTGSTRVLADNSPGTVFAVDHWRGSEEHAEELASKPADWLYSQFSENLREHLQSGKVVAMRMPSIEAADYFRLRGMRFDMIFIDGSHDDASIRADILAWKPLVCEGGIFSGHDCCPDSPIEHAVRELIGQPQLCESIWYFTKK